MLGKDDVNWHKMPDSETFEKHTQKREVRK